MTNKMTPREILIDCIRRNVRLTPSGSKLIVDHVGELDPAFKSVLRENKPALLRLLTNLRHTARQVLAGEFDGCSVEEFYNVQELLLDNLNDTLCADAIYRLEALALKNGL